MRTGTLAGGVLVEGGRAVGVRYLQDHPWCVLMWHTPATPSLVEAATADNLAR